MDHRTTVELTAGLDHIRSSPADGGALVLIATRPIPGEREELETARLGCDLGLVGDGWLERGSRHSPDGSAEIDRQLTIVNARAMALFAGDPARRSLAGDQLYVDLDVSSDNLPPGTQLGIGEAVVEVTTKPHTGCAKFTKRFGLDVTRFINSPDGQTLRVRGINARVVQSGAIAVGDLVRKVVLGRSFPA